MQSLRLLSYHCSAHRCCRPGPRNSMFIYLVYLFCYSLVLSIVTMRLRSSSVFGVTSNSSNAGAPLTALAMSPYWMGVLQSHVLRVPTQGKTLLIFLRTSCMNDPHCVVCALVLIFVVCCKMEKYPLCWSRRLFQTQAERSEV